MAADIGYMNNRLKNCTLLFVLLFFTIFTQVKKLEQVRPMWVYSVIICGGDKNLVKGL